MRISDWSSDVCSSDLVKNIAFLMDKRGRWSLSPAFDLTYSYNPSGTWTARHQMTLNGKRDDFTMDDFKQCAHAASMKRGRSQRIVAEVIAAVKRWPEFAQAANVDALWRPHIKEIGRASCRERVWQSG